MDTTKDSSKPEDEMEVAPKPSDPTMMQIKVYSPYQVYFNDYFLYPNYSNSSFESSSANCCKYEPFDEKIQ